MARFVWSLARHSDNMQMLSTSRSAPMIHHRAEKCITNSGMSFPSRQHLLPPRWQPGCQTPELQKSQSSFATLGIHGLRCFPQRKEEQRLPPGSIDHWLHRQS